MYSCTTLQVYTGYNNIIPVQTTYYNILTHTRILANIMYTHTAINNIAKPAADDNIYCSRYYTQREIGTRPRGDFVKKQYYNVHGHNIIFVHARRLNIICVMCCAVFSNRMSLPRRSAETLYNNNNM